MTDRDLRYLLVDACLRACADFWHGVLLGVLFIVAGHCFLCRMQSGVAVTVLYNVVMVNYSRLKSGACSSSG